MRGSTRSGAGVTAGRGRRGYTYVGAQCRRGSVTAQQARAEARTGAGSKARRMSVENRAAGSADPKLQKVWAALHKTEDRAEFDADRKKSLMTGGMKEMAP